ncbi:armadillo-type protein [Mycena crocata]|nr:armadillo-type protein [Mycena crocata]
MYALSQIANSADGASAVVGARALDFVAELFESPNLKVRRYACSMLSNLASEESSREAVLGSVAGLVGTIRDAVTDAVDAGAFDSLLLLFESANEEVRRCACALLGRFAVHRFTAGASLNTAQCVRVVAFLRDTDTLVVEGAIYALSQIANSSDGAGAVVAAAALDYLPALFQSPNTQVWRYTSWMLGNLANDKSAREAVLASTSRLVSPLSDNVVNLVDARALDSIFVLLESPNKEVRRTSCSLLGRLAVHQSTAGAALTTRGVVTLLQIYALSQIANNSDGANAVVGARALDFVVALFDTRAQADASSKLSNLADDESTREEVVPCQQLATLLRDHDLVVVQNAIYSLSHIVRSPDGAQTVVDAKVLDFAPELLESSHKLVQLYTCRMLGRLATHSSTLDAVLCAKPCARLAALLCHNIVGEGAIYALSHISADLNGAKAVIDAGALNFVHKLFDSPSNEIRERAHLMVGNLVQYGSAKACVCFAALLREHNMSVIKNSISVLAKIAREPDGAKAVVDAKVLDIVPELLETPNDQVRQFTCNMLGRLVKHKSTLEAVLSANLCIRLIAVLYHDDLFIAWEAMQTLSTIANDLAGAEAVVDAKVLDFIPNLIESPDKLGGNRFTCDMLCRLARHKSTLGAVLSAQPFAWLTTFLYDDENVVVKRATEALAIIADDPTGAQAVVDAKALNVVPKLLESPNAQVRQSTCNMLSRLAKHESTLDAVLSESSASGGSLLSYNISVVKRATEALAIIADDPTGAKALVDAKVLDFVPELLQLPNVGVRRFTCNMMSRLARKESTLDAVLSEKLYFQRLVALLRYLRRREDDGSPSHNCR